MVKPSNLNPFDKRGTLSVQSPKAEATQHKTTTNLPVLHSFRSFFPFLTEHRPHRVFPNCSRQYGSGSSDSGHQRDWQSRDLKTNPAIVKQTPQSC